MVQVFRDDFMRPNGALGANWQSLGINGGDIQIVDHSAVGLVLGGGASFAIARTTVALDDIEQKGRLAFAIQSTPAIVRLGFHSVELAGAGLQTIGFAVQVTFTSPTEARVAVLTNPRGDVLVTLPGEIKTTLVTPLLNVGTCLDVVQELRAEVRRALGGTELLVWFNDDDDERPLLKWRFTDDPQTAAKPYFAIWNDTDTNFAEVGEVEFAVARDLSSRRADLFFPDERPTLGELREAVTEIVERHRHSPTMDAALIDRALNDAQSSLVNRLRDFAGFLRILEDVTVEFDTTLRETRLPRRVGRLLGLWAQNQPHTDPPLEFRVIGHDPQGQLRVVVPAGQTTLRVLYEPPIEPMVADYDRAMIPRRFREVLVAGAAMRMFRDATHEKELRIWTATEATLFAEMRYALQGEQRARMSPLEVRPVEVRTENPRGY